MLSPTIMTTIIIMMIIIAIAAITNAITTRITTIIAIQMHHSANEALQHMLWSSERVQLQGSMPRQIQKRPGLKVPKGTCTLTVQSLASR